MWCWHWRWIDFEDMKFWSVPGECIGQVPNIEKEKISRQLLLHCQLSGGVPCCDTEWGNEMCCLQVPVHLLLRIVTRKRRNGRASTRWVKMLMLMKGWLADRLDECFVDNLLVSCMGSMVMQCCRVVVFVSYTPLWPNLLLLETITVVSTDGWF